MPGVLLLHRMLMVMASDGDDDDEWQSYSLADVDDSACKPCLLLLLLLFTSGGPSW